MVRAKGPLLSVQAQKQLGQSLIYKQKGSRSFITGYNKPGGKNRLIISPTQLNQRMLFNLLIARWQTFTANEKAIWNDDTRRKTLGISGWNLFLREALKDLPTYLGLQAYWSFNRIVNEQILDLSGNNNHGDLWPTPPNNVPVLVDSIGPKFGKAGSFDGIDDQIRLSSRMTINRNSATIILWVYATKSFVGQYTNQAYIVGIRLDKFRTFLGLLDLGGVAYELRGETLLNGEHFVTANNAIPKGQWCHIAISFDSGTATTYVNKIQVDQKAGLTANLEINVIGQTHIETIFGGLIDDVQFYNRALSLTEIEKHYDLIAKK